MSIARWAENINVNHCRELSDELDEIIMALSYMELGPEFEFSESELNLLADKLINEEENPLSSI